MTRQPCRFLGSLALLCSSLGCTHYRTLTVPPPGHLAELDVQDNAITLSPGVAFGFECRGAWGDPCSRGQPGIADPGVARVYPAYLDDLRWFRGGESVATSYVVVGVSVGRTKLTIPGEDPLTVEVVAR